MLNCIFSEPLYFNPLTNQLSPLDGDVLKTTTWAYSKVDCVGDLGGGASTSTLPIYIEKISSSTNEFYLDKNISYGDFLTIAFLILIFLCLTIGGIREFAKNRKLERL